MSVGQGSLTATPLHMVRMMAAVANGGRLVTPHVTKEGSGSGFRVQERNGEAIRDFVIAAHARNGPRGAATRRGRSEGDRSRHGLHGVAAIAGKTGTAETGGDQASHAWFAG